MRRFDTHRVKAMLLMIGIFFACLLISDDLAVSSFGSEDFAIESPLSSDERAWLDDHSGKIRLAPAPYWKPMEFFDEEGNYHGLVADYMNLIQQRLGFAFTIVRAQSWNEVLELAKSHRIDVISAAYDTPERRNYMSWTEPYLEVPEVIVTRKSWKGELSLDQMEGLKVGVTRSYVVADWIRNTYPQVTLTLVPNDQAGLRMVAFGELDAMIAELPVATDSIEKEKITNLRVAGKTGFNSVLSIGVRNDWPILAGIMEKGLGMITPEERKAIYKKWINLGEYPPFFNRGFWYVFLTLLIGGLVLSVLVFVWNLTLRRKVQEKTDALTQELRDRKSTRLNSSHYS